MKRIDNPGGNVASRRMAGANNFARQGTFENGPRDFSGFSIDNRLQRDLSRSEIGYQMFSRYKTAGICRTELLHELEIHNVTKTIGGPDLVRRIDRDPLWVASRDKGSQIVVTQD